MCFTLVGGADDESANGLLHGQWEVGWPSEGEGWGHGDRAEWA